MSATDLFSFSLTAHLNPQQVNAIERATGMRVGRVAEAPTNHHG